jgi:two-component system sensor histidine kinase KdpD
MERRPNPEELLKSVQEEERLAQRGKLKVYLGAAPGVGKTYMMLQDALAKRAQGLDVIVGVVESHGRQEIISLLNNFEILPRQEIDYRGNKIAEFDLDSALNRSTGLFLMDEMAHTNAPGLRHEKRWQDIKEMLDRGIDVYTTINVQHIESLSDLASQIIHARVKETVPDIMLETADTIELVDLPPEDLLKRLQDGKVYFPRQAELAAEHFFQKGNLIALRELALRFTAERVGAQVLLYRQGRGIRHVWPSRDKILVCVGSGPETTKVIRAARRMAASLQAKWIALRIDSPRFPSTEEQHDRVIQNLRFAEKSGAETRIITGFDLAKDIINFARENNITKIIIWKRINSRWRDFLFGNLADDVMRISNEIDVYIITGEDNETPLERKTPLKQVIPWKVYAMSLGMVALCTALDFILYPYLHVSNLIMVYLLGVTIVALFGRSGPSTVASVLSVLAYGFFFTPQTISFSLNDMQYFFTLIVMLLVTQVISHLTVLSRRQAQAASLAEHRTATLHRLSQQLATARGVDKLLDIGSRYMGEVFDSEVIVLLPEGNQLMIRANYRTDPVLSAKEQGVAQWVYDLGQVAGLGTDTLPFSEAIYIPLLASHGSIGVLRVHPAHSQQLLAPEQMRLLEACVNQLASAIEVDRLEEQTKRAESQTSADPIGYALLQGVTRDLRTPLVAMMGAATTLMEMPDALDTAKIKKLGEDINLEAGQLNRLLNNLLQMTYLEAETVKLEKESHSLKEILQVVLKAENAKLGKRAVYTHIPNDLPKVPLAAVLIQEVFINLIDNAIKFTPPESPIEIAAYVEKDHIVVSVADHGPGIAVDEMPKLFEKFYRGRMLTTERGLGLGLAICKSIIKAHGGEIWAVNRKEGGTAFRFTLPLN